MNSNYAFLEFYVNEKIEKSLVEASNERLVPRSQRKRPIVLYLLSLAVAVATAFLAI